MTAWMKPLTPRAHHRNRPRNVTSISHAGRRRTTAARLGPVTGSNHSAVALGSTDLRFEGVSALLAAQPRNRSSPGWRFHCVPVARPTPPGTARDDARTHMIAVVSKLGLVAIALFVAILAWLLYV